MLSKINTLPSAITQYMVITANYWTFTLTDGALRMLVLLHFYQLGYTPLELAMLFVFYEFFGVITNLVGGWLGARIGLNKTMNIGLFLQVFALLMLAVPSGYLTVAYLMTAQALSGIAKDLNKMSAKSSIKLLIVDGSTFERQSKLFKWVALLTGSKNTLKGIGFFLGGLLLTSIGFQAAMLLMASVLAVVALFSLFLLKTDLGKSKFKPKFSQMFAKSSALNYLAAARLCLFAARDVWFVIALPVFLASQLDWSHQHVGLFFALWVIAYGIVQAYVPAFFSQESAQKSVQKNVSQNRLLIDGKLIARWSAFLALVTLLLLITLSLSQYAEVILILGLFVFGAVFAVNSSLHSYFIVALAKDDAISMDVGFYYMANALGRLIGTVLSGFLYQSFASPQQGLFVCLAVSALLALASAFYIRRVE